MSVVTVTMTVAGEHARSTRATRPRTRSIACGQKQEAS